MSITFEQFLKDTAVANPDAEVFIFDSDNNAINDIIFSGHSEDVSLKNSLYEPDHSFNGGNSVIRGYVDGAIVYIDLNN